MEQRRAIAYIPNRQSAQPHDSGFPRDARLDIVDTVRGTPGTGAERGTIADALNAIAEGKASVLLVARLSDAAASSRELIALLSWLQQAGGDLVALDVRLDTASPGGRRTVATLREVQRWEHAPPAGRPPRGRPGLAARAPELSARIATMREGGLSLQAIADALNADGVPTQRGGARWRPSGVQAALGYRRPHRPPHGAPPPPRPAQRPIPPPPPARGGHKAAPPPPAEQGPR